MKKTARPKPPMHFDKIPLHRVKAIVSANAGGAAPPNLLVEPVEAKSEPYSRITPAARAQGRNAR